MVSRWIEYVGLKISWKSYIAINKYWCNTSVDFSKNVQDDSFNLIQKVLSLISKSQTNEKKGN